MSRILYGITYDVMYKWRDEAERQGRKIRVDVQMEGIPAILGRPADVREVFTKLVLHVVTNMPAGGTITVSARHEPGYTAERGDGWVIATVRDTGDGMPETVRERIFDPFFGTKYLRGVGVGLSTVRDVMQGHGGRIGVTSVLHEGSTFTLRFQASAVRPATKAQEAEVPLVPGRRILVVDDNPGLLETLATMLEEAGLKVLPAESGEVALRLLDQSPVDLVLTDLGMPGLTGWQVAEAVKAKAPWTPVVLLTGWGEQAVNEETRRRAFVDRILFKPVQRTVLLNMVATMTTAAEVPA
ncbi:MAG: response regulator [Candidatus Methylomirabilales bacterium]